MAELSCLSQNLRSISSAYDTLKLFLESKSFDVVAGQETWSIIGSYPLPGFQPPLYKQRTNKRGGGVIFWVSNTVTYEHMTDIDIFDEGKYESLAIRIGKYVLINFYRPPQADVSVMLNHMESQVSKIYKQKLTPLLFGDANVNFAGNCNKKISLENKLLNLDLKQLIYSSTRPAAGRASVIDHVYCPIHIDLSTSVLASNISDHLGINFSINIKDRKISANRCDTFFSYSEKNVCKVRGRLSEINWIEWGKLPPEEMASSFTDKLSNLVTECCLVNKKIKKVKNEWYSKELSKLSVKCKKFQKKLAINPSEKNAAAYALIKKSYNKKLRSEKTKFIQKKFADTTCPKKTWSVINDITNREKLRHNYPNKFKDNNTCYDSPGTIANGFNNYYRSIAQNLENKLPKPKKKNTYSKWAFNSRLELGNVSNADVLNAINSLKPKASYSTDNISNRLLKEVKYEILTPLRILLNKCFNHGIFPDKWKTAKILPLYKSKGDKSSFGNYRPISLLCSISKIMEKVIVKQVTNHFKKYNLFNKRQFGFRDGHSTVDALIDFISSVEDLSKEEEYVSVFFDFSKAFDTLNHSILYNRLESYGLSKKSVDIFKSYLTGRKQYVYLDGTTSEIASSPDIGCPQGSVLGPLCFLIYINSISNDINCLSFLFADDTVATIKNKLANLSNVAHEKLELFKEWFITNRLSLNHQKTVFLSSNKDISLSLDDQQIERIQGNNSFKYLGIELQEKLKPDAHYNRVINKIRPGIYALAKIKRMAPISVKKQVYYSLIHSHLQYGITVYYRQLKLYQRKKIFLLQKKAVRYIFNSKYNSHCDPLFYKAGIPKFADMAELAGLKSICNIIDRKEPASLFEKITQRENARRSNGEWTSKYKIIDTMCKIYNKYRKTNIWDPYYRTKNGQLTLCHPSPSVVVNRLKSIKIKLYDRECSDKNCKICVTANRVADNTS